MDTNTAREECSTCGRSRTWVRRSRPRTRTRNASSRGADTTPEWVTPAEAAFLIRGSKQTILEWIEAGRLEGEAVIGSDRPFALVRTIDVRALAEDNGT